MTFLMPLNHQSAPGLMPTRIRASKYTHSWNTPPSEMKASPLDSLCTRSSKRRSPSFTSSMALSSITVFPGTRSTSSSRDVLAWVRGIPVAMERASVVVDFPVEYVPEMASFSLGLSLKLGTSSAGTVGRPPGRGARGSAGGSAGGGGGAFDGLVDRHDGRVLEPQVLHGLGEALGHVAVDGVHGHARGLQGGQPQGGGQVPEVLVDRAVVRGQPELHRHVHEGLVGGAGVASHQQADVVHGRLERGRDRAA